MWTPPTPTRAMASRSRVIPSAETLPFIQCHQVCGRAEAGGCMNALSKMSAELPPGLS